MKVKQWTAGLAAVGLVSLPALVQAEEKASAVMTALSSTTISGYVDTSAQWDIGTGNANPPGFIYNKGKQDGFNLDKVKLRIERPLDESQWAAGYRVDLLFGPDANTFGSTSSGLSTADLAIQQAYVALRAPVLNNLDFKVGVFDSVIGYESHDSINNPNFTRSYGTTIEPHTHTGILVTYQAADWLGLAVGIANTVGPTINARAFNNPSGNNKAESYKSYMASFALTAPDNLGFLKGSTFYGGVVSGFNGNTNSVGSAASGFTGVDQTSWYAGSTIATPLSALKLGASYDYLGIGTQANVVNPYYANAAALYASIEATEKLSFHTRAEYFWQRPASGVATLPAKVFALTETLQYDLWRNVLSRLEIRWDHQAGTANPGVGIADRAYGGDPSGTGLPSKKNAVLVAANLIYKF